MKDLFICIVITFFQLGQFCWAGGGGGRGWTITSSLWIRPYEGDCIVRVQSCANKAVLANCCLPGYTSLNLFQQKAIQTSRKKSLSHEPYQALCIYKIKMGWIWIRIFLFSELNRIYWHKQGSITIKKNQKGNFFRFNPRIVGIITGLCENYRRPMGVLRCVWSQPFI